MDRGRENACMELTVLPTVPETGGGKIIYLESGGDEKTYETAFRIRGCTKVA